MVFILHNNHHLISGITSIGVDIHRSSFIVGGRYARPSVDISRLAASGFCRHLAGAHAGAEHGEVAFYRQGDLRPVEYRLNRSGSLGRETAIGSAHNNSVGASIQVAEHRIRLVVATIKRVLVVGAHR